MRVFKNFMFRYPILGRFLVCIIFPLFITLSFYCTYLLNSLPNASKTNHFNGLKNETSITRDKFSIPSIVAQTDKDAFSALGYAHAQDRLWQMELNRRLLAGRISEVIGAKGLGSDKYMRVLGLYRDTLNQWEKLEPETKVFIEAYTDGVNASLKNYSVLPPEFIYYQLTPAPWTVYDSLAIIELMAWSMSSNYNAEIKRTLLLEIFGKKKAADLMPEVSGVDIDLASSHLNKTELNINNNLTAAMASIDVFGINKLFSGSNNWVISGLHSQTGSPLLASDPHLQTGSPSVWYIARLRGNTLNVVGATFPGFPFVILGHNANIGWGITNMGADVQDLRLEQIDLKNREQYLKDGVPNDIYTRTEYISVRPDFLKKAIDPVPITIRETSNGPLISDAIGGLNGTSYSVSWAGKLGIFGSIESFRKINYATDWDSFKKALHSYTVPAQNFIFADIIGNIGYIGAGKIPIRQKGNGAFPVPGWSSDYDWTGYIPFTELPQSFNPSSGVLVTANNKIVDDTYKYHITSDWAPAYRADRILEIINSKINSKQKLSPDDFRIMQGDTVSLAAKKIIPYLKKIRPEHTQEKAALEYIETWDANLSTDSVAATIFESWIKNLHRSILEDEIDIRTLSPEKKYIIENIIENPSYSFLEGVLGGSKAEWCDYRKTKTVETCDEILLASLRITLDELKSIAGSRMESWNWGSIHKTQYTHYPFSKSEFSPIFPSDENKLLHFLAHRSYSSGGDENTINVAPASGKNGNVKFQQFWMASYRQVIDLAAVDNSLFMVSPGQSGNLLSPHYDDLKEAHENLVLIPVKGTNEEALKLILK